MRRAKRNHFTEVDCPEGAMVMKTLELTDDEALLLNAMASMGRDILNGATPIELIKMTHISSAIANALGSNVWRSLSDKMLVFGDDFPDRAFELIEGRLPTAEEKSEGEQLYKEELDANASSN